jgi:hypothetical protein
MAYTRFENFGNLAMVFFLRFARDQSSKHGGHVDGNQSRRFRADVLGAFLRSRPGILSLRNGWRSTVNSLTTIRCVG